MLILLKNRYDIWKHILNLNIFQRNYSRLTLLPTESILVLAGNHISLFLYLQLDSTIHATVKLAKPSNSHLVVERS